VGMSGAASFPHLHLSVRHEGRVVDPFRPEAGPGCGGPEGALWAAPVDYDSGRLLSAGLTDGVPDYDAIKAGLPEDGLGPAAPAAVLWAYVVNGQAGDVIAFEIMAPDGPFGREEIVLERDQPFLFRAWGRRAPPGGLPAGRWEGRALLRRGDTVLGETLVTATLP